MLRINQKHKELNQKTNNSVKAKENEVKQWNERKNEKKFEEEERERKTTVKHKTKNKTFSTQLFFLAGCCFQL
jgi:hypothetical protein